MAINAPHQNSITLNLIKTKYNGIKGFVHKNKISQNNFTNSLRFNYFFHSIK